MWVGFFYLLQPGEYLHTKTKHAFQHLQDIILKVNHSSYNGTSIPMVLLPSVAFAGLRIDEQKNGVKGEIIGLTTTSDPSACTIRVL